jgi:hypothetical protein
MGEFGSRYAVSAECIGDARVRIISEMSITSPDAKIVELPLGSSGWKHLGLEFTPGDLMMTVAWNDTVVLRHRLRYLVTAPSQVHFGWDPSLGNKKTFDGRIRAWPPAVFGGVLRNE